MTRTPDDLFSLHARVDSLEVAARAAIQTIDEWDDTDGGADPLDAFRHVAQLLRAVLHAPERQADMSNLEGVLALWAEHRRLADKEYRRCKELEAEAEKKMRETGGDSFKGGGARAFWEQQVLTEKDLFVKWLESNRPDLVKPLPVSDALAALKAAGADWHDGQLLFEGEPVEGLAAERRFKVTKA